jgi:hypothetical protein
MSRQKKEIIKDDETSAELLETEEERLLRETIYPTEDPNWKGVKFFNPEGRFLRVCFSKYYCGISLCKQGIAKLSVSSS